MKEEDVIKYPKLKYLHESPYGGRELLGKLIFFEEKRDGSNIRCFLDEISSFSLSYFRKVSVPHV